MGIGSSWVNDNLTASLFTPGYNMRRVYTYSYGSQMYIYGHLLYTNMISIKHIPIIFQISILSQLISKKNGPKKNNPKPTFPDLRSSL